MPGALEACSHPCAASFNMGRSQCPILPLEVVLRCTDVVKNPFDRLVDLGVRDDLYQLSCAFMGGWLRKKGLKDVPPAHNRVGGSKNTLKAVLFSVPYSIFADCPIIC